MKKLIFSLLLILTGLICVGQSIDDISLPTHVVDSIILDLADYDRLKVDYDSIKSTVTIYEIELENRMTIIREAIITVDEYTVLVQMLQEQGKLKDERIKVAYNKINKLRFGHVVRTVVEALIVVLIIMI